MADGAGGAHGAAGGELVDVIDDDGGVVGTATRAEVRAGNLRHRTVCIAVVTTADEIVCHQRADWKDVWPSHWDVCFGGVVDAGEDWETAARRELAEEAGVAVGPGDLELVGEGSYADELVRSHARLYVARHDGPFAFADGEVVATALVPRADLQTWVAQHPVVPDSEAIVVPMLVHGTGPGA